MEKKHLKVCIILFAFVGVFLCSYAVFSKVGDGCCANLGTTIDGGFEAGYCADDVMTVDDCCPADGDYTSTPHYPSSSTACINDYWTQQSCEVFPKCAPGYCFDASQTDACYFKSEDLCLSRDPKNKWSATDEPDECQLGCCCTDTSAKTIIKGACSIEKGRWSAEADLPQGQTCDVFCTKAPGCTDEDNDGYGEPKSMACAHKEEDCDDTNSSINPGAIEICGNKVDDDCDGLIDIEDPDCGSKSCSNYNKDKPGCAAADCFWCPREGGKCISYCDENSCPGYKTKGADSECKSQCGDSIDNDKDGKTDTEESCCQSTYSTNAEDDPCCDTSMEPPALKLGYKCTLGEKAITVKWDNAGCIDNLVKYVLYRSPAGEAVFPIELDVSKTSYKDENTEWAGEYTYKLTAVYKDEREQESNNVFVNTGESICEGQEKNTEFCVDENYGFEGDKVYGILCFESEENRKCNDFLIKKDCASAGQKCLGPNYNKETFCKGNPGCEELGNPFGLYYAKDTCLGSITGGAIGLNACYYTPSFTIVDKCTSCAGGMSCYDYKSSDSCAVDNCIAGNGEKCTWKDTEVTLGKGICYQPDYEGTDKCGMCDEFLMGCTPQDCSYLGACYYSEAKKACDACLSPEESRCELYKDENSCTGKNPIHPVYNTCPLPYSKSQDSCSIGLCYWDTKTKRCFKDANVDKTADCGSNSVDCQVDKTPASVTTDFAFGTSTVYSSADNPTINFDYGEDTGAEISYCIVCGDYYTKEETDEPSLGYYPQYACCPNTLLFGTSLELAKIDAIKNFEGTCTFVYTSEDWNKNLQEPFEGTLNVDFRAPEIDLSYIVENDSADPSKSNLYVTAELSEDATCIDSLEPQYGTFTGNDGTTEGRTFTATAMGLPDYTYTYTITCSDAYGNTVTKTESIKISRIAMISYVWPYNETLNTGSIQLTIASANPDGTCYFNNDPNDPATFTGETDSMTPANFLYKSDLKTFEQGSYRINATCLFEQDGNTVEDNELIFFTVDTTPPETKAYKSDGMMTPEEMDFSKTYPIGHIDFSIEFVCNDPDFGAEGDPSSFGCAATYYCINENDASTTCEPTEEGNISMETLNSLNASSTICYYSVDNGNNIEPTQCRTFLLGEAPEITVTIDGAGEENTVTYGDYPVYVASDTAIAELHGLNYTFQPRYQEGIVTVNIPLSAGDIENTWYGTLSITNASEYNGLRNATAEFDFIGYGANGVQGAIVEGKYFYISTDWQGPDDPEIYIE